MDTTLYMTLHVVMILSLRTYWRGPLLILQTGPAGVMAVTLNLGSRTSPHITLEIELSVNALKSIEKLILS